MARRVTARTQGAWASPVRHHIQAGRWDALCALLTDFDFLEARCREVGSHAAPRADETLMFRPLCLGVPV